MKTYKIGDILLHTELNITLVVAGWCSWLDGEHYACYSVISMNIYPIEYLKDYYVKIGSLD